MAVKYTSQGRMSDGFWRLINSTLKAFLKKIPTDLEYTTLKTNKDFNTALQLISESITSNQQFD